MAVTPIRRLLSDHASISVRCSVGDVGLDQLLRGGIPCGSVTEIFGVISSHSIIYIVLVLCGGAL